MASAVFLERQVVLPAVPQSAYGGCREPRSILSEQGAECLRKITGRNALQVQYRQKRLDRRRAPQVRRQDRRREPDAAWIIGGCLAVAHARLANGHGADAGHHFVLRQVAVADDALAAVIGLETDMLGVEAGNLGFYRLGEQGVGPVAQDFGELILEGSWLIGLV